MFILYLVGLVVGAIVTGVAAAHEVIEHNGRDIPNIIGMGTIVSIFWPILITFTIIALCVSSPFFLGMWLYSKYKGIPMSKFLE